jgi:hypothetical protein
MTFLQAQRATRRGGHRLVDAGRTPNGLFRMLVCERCGGRILARSPDEAGGDIASWSCTPRDARERPVLVDQDLNGYVCSVVPTPQVGWLRHILTVL